MAYEVYKKEHWGVTGDFLRLIENLSVLVFQQQNRHYSFGDAYVVHKNNLEKASLSTLPTSHTERARAPALAFQGNNTMEKGLGEDLNEKGQGQAEKVTSWHSWFELVPGSTTICFFRTTP